MEGSATINAGSLAEELDKLDLSPSCWELVSECCAVVLETSFNKRSGDTTNHVVMAPAITTVDPLEMFLIAPPTHDNEALHSATGYNLTSFSEQNTFFSVFNSSFNPVSTAAPTLPSTPDVPRITTCTSISVPLISPEPRIQPERHTHFTSSPYTPGKYYRDEMLKGNITRPRSTKQRNAQEICPSHVRCVAALHHRPKEQLRVASTPRINLSNGESPTVSHIPHSTALDRRFRYRPYVKSSKCLPYRLTGSSTPPFTFADSNFRPVEGLVWRRRSSRSFSHI